MRTVQQTMEISQVPFLALLLTRLLLCNERCLGAQCLVRQWIHVLRQFKEGFMGKFLIFPREGGTLDPRVDSRLFLLAWPKRKWPLSSSPWQWHVFYWFCW